MRLRNVASRSSRVLPIDGPARQVAFAPDGKWLAVVSSKPTVQLWSLDGGAAESLAGHTDRVEKIAFSADGRLLASASLDGTIRIHDLATHDSRVLRGHTDGVVGVEFSRDGRHLLSWGWWDDRTIRVWDVASGQPVEVLHSTRYVMNAMLSQHDTAIVTGDEDGVVRLWPIGDARALPSDAGLRRDLDEMTTATLVEGRLATP